MTDNTAKPPLGEAEFTALRAEIMQRAKFQQQLVNLSVIIAGMLLTVFFQFSGPSFLLLSYPLLAMFMAMEWSFNNMRILQIGCYIRTEIESKWAGPGWETYLVSPVARTSLHWLSGTIFAYGTFIGLPIVVVALTIITRFTWVWSAIVFLVVDAVVSILVIPVIIRSSQRTECHDTQYRLTSQSS